MSFAEILKKEATKEGLEAEMYDLKEFKPEFFIKS